MLLRVSQVFGGWQPHILHLLDVLAHLKQRGPLLVCDRFQALLEESLWVLTRGLGGGSSGWSSLLNGFVIMDWLSRLCLSIRDLSLIPHLYIIGRIVLCCLGLIRLQLD